MRNMRHTPQDAAVLKAFDELVRKEGWPPSTRRLAARMGVTYAAVGKHLQRLGAQGVMKKMGPFGTWVRK